MQEVVGAVPCKRHAGSNGAGDFANYSTKTTEITVSCMMQHIGVHSPQRADEAERCHTRKCPERYSKGDTAGIQCYATTQHTSDIEAKQGGKTRHNGTARRCLEQRDLVYMRDATYKS